MPSSSFAFVRILPAAALLVLPLSAGRAQAPATRHHGIIGRYTAPREWPLRKRRFDLLHQRIAVSFDMDRRLLQGRVTTTVAATEPRTTEIRLDAGNLTIDSALTAAGQPIPFTFDTTQVTVRLPKPAARGDTVAFTLVYHTVPERGIYFVPRRGVIWSQGEATETRNWIPTYDAANDKTTWEFFVTADTGQKVLSNGRLAGVTDATGGRRVWHWVQSEPASTYLYSVVVGPFTILQDRWRGVPVEYWVSPDTVNAAWRTFGETPSMIELYSRVLGVPYPWDKYAQSVIPDFTYGGMENVSATTQTDLALHSAADEPDQSGRSLNAHELAHQWFGDLTTAADWSHIWLNEGLTTYMESVQNEKSRGWDAGQQSWFNQQRQAMDADLNQARPLVWGTYPGDDPIVLFFSGHVYPKGAQVAHQLRRLLGDSLFWAGMHRFLVDNAHRPVTTADYAAAMEKVSHRDLDWFFDQWAYGIGYPKVKVTRRWDPSARRLAVTVDQMQPIDSLHPLFRFPVTVRVTTRDSLVRRELMVTRAHDTFFLPLPAQPTSFRFDEGGWLLGTVQTDQTPAELAEMAGHDVEWAARNWALRALGESTDSVADAARRFIVLSERSPALREVALEQLQKHEDPATLDVVRSALRDPVPSVRAAALGTLATLDPTAAATEARSAYAGDPSSTVKMMAAAVAAGTESPDSALAILLDAAAPGRWHGMRTAVAPFLAKAKDPRAADALERMTAPTEPRAVRTTALDALVARGDSARAAAVAAKYIDDPDPLFAVAAVKALATTGAAAGRATLEQAAKKESRVTVLAALRQALAAR